MTIRVVDEDIKKRFDISRIKAGFRTAQDFIKHLLDLFDKKEQESVESPDLDEIY